MNSMPSLSGRKVGHKSKIALIVVGSLVVFVLLLHLILPFLLKNYINSKLGNLPEYRGHVESVSLELLRGAFRLHDFKIEKINHKIPTPFVEVDVIDASLRWRELFHDKIVSKVGFASPKVNFVDGPSPETSQAKVPDSWQTALKNLSPFQVNLLWIRNGAVHFRNFQSQPPVDIYLEDLNLTATGLTNEPMKAKELPGHATLEAKVMKTGHLKVDTKLDILAEPPKVEAKVEVKNIHLQDLNPFFLAYGKFDVQSGDFNLFGEGVTSKGQLEGYVKPFMLQPIVLGDANKKEKIEQAVGAKKPNPLWETLIAATAAIFKNHPKDMEAARIPFHGDLSHVKIDIWSSVWSVLSNAFIKPQSPGIENSESLQKLKSDADKKAKK